MQFGFDKSSLIEILFNFFLTCWFYFNQNKEIETCVFKGPQL